MKKVLFCAAILAMAAFGFAGSAKADTVTDTTLNVVYTATVSGSQVTLTVDATGFSAGSGFLTAVAMQFTGASGATLISATGGVNAWSQVQPGGLNSGGCNGQGNFFCTQNISANLVVPASGIYTFVFDVTGLSGTDSDIKAAYNVSADNSGKNLGLTSQGIDLGPPTSTPEPASMLLLGLGLVGAPFLRRRKA